jgi:hypothetical protein
VNTHKKSNKGSSGHATFFHADLPVVSGVRLFNPGCSYIVFWMGPNKYVFYESCIICAESILLNHGEFDNLNNDRESLVRV